MAKLFLAVSNPSSTPQQTIVDRIAAWPCALTADDLSGLLNLSTDVLYKYAKRGLPHFRLGSMIRFDGQQVADWLRERNQGIATSRTSRRAA